MKNHVEMYWMVAAREPIVRGRPTAIEKKVKWPVCYEASRNFVTIDREGRHRLEVAWIDHKHFEGRIEVHFEPQAQADLVDLLKNEEGWTEL